MAETRISLLSYKIPREGMPPFEFDFAELTLSFDVARAFRRALEAQMGHTSIDTQSKAFMALRKFAECLDERGYRKISPLPRDVLPIFANWLDKSSLGPSAQVCLIKVKQLIAWCERNTPNILSKDTELVINPIRNIEYKAAKPGLPEPDVKKILKACYEDIEKIEEKRREVRRILSGATKSANELEFLLITRELIQLGKGRLAKQPVYHRAGNSLPRRIDDIGGSRHIAETTYLSPKDLIPFVVAISAQVSGNPESLRIANADCVVTHPIRDDIERIVWLKRRSAKEQRADFPKGKEWNAPNLVRRLNTLTEDLRPKASRKSRDKLFICYQWFTRTVGIPSKYAMLQELNSFIERHSLPPFQLKDLRRTGGQIVQAVRGNARDAQIHLNHASPNTTRLYTATQAVADAEDQVIHTYQVQFARLAKAGKIISPDPQSNNMNLEIPAQGMDTTFGYLCKDPLSGIAPGSVRGNMCQKFFGCATCPGAFIPLDNVEVVARLISTAEALGEARTRAQVDGWWKRYEAIYEPIRVQIISELLPAVSAPIIQRARPLANARQIPRLE